MKYQGTIKGKEKDLGNLRRTLTQNQDDYFNYGFENFRETMVELYNLYYTPDVELSKIDSKISYYLSELFKDEYELFDKVYLLIPDEQKILNKLFADDELEDLFDKSLKHSYDQLIHEHQRYTGFYDLFEKLLTELFKSKLETQDGKIKLIRNFLFKNTINGVKCGFILSSKGNVDFIKQIFETEISDDLIDGLLTDFYIYCDEDNYLDNEKYPLTSSGNKVKLKDINFDLTEEDGFYNLDFVVNISKIGIVKFQLNFLPTYNVVKKSKVKEEQKSEVVETVKLLQINGIYEDRFGYQRSREYEYFAIDDSSEERKNIINDYLTPADEADKKVEDFILGKIDNLLISRYNIGDDEPNQYQIIIKTYEEAKAEYEKEFKQNMRLLNTTFEI